MLNWNTVLRYIHNNLALPSSYIELTDDQMKEAIIMKSIPEFSKHYPDTEYTSVIVTDSRYKHEIRQNWFYFYDDEDLDIYGIKECFMNLDGPMFAGHPYMEPMSFESLTNWSLDVFKSRFFLPFSQFNYTYHFEQPNYIQVLPSPTSNFVVYYEREQPHDLRRISNQFKTDFLDLALAEIKILIGSTRTMYGQGQISTPFGEINLNGDMLRQEGVDLKREVLDRMYEEAPPAVVIDIG